ncbi:ras-related protein Rab-28 [Nilaparvata lugens]|uniref:ras-related protein Rab-28 n=1 Tax=Nilaparvata lugens TaxID=108931 RepID=UPI00193DD57C|nr:ras-related protein Rab-28 [Nilaparvata lugens]
MSDNFNDCIEKVIKIAILGEPSVGKTALATRYCHEDFSRQYYPTAGADFFLKRTVVQGNRPLRLVIWDLSGHSLGSDMFDKYMYGAQIVMLLFDITNANSFTRLVDWLEASRRVLRDKKPTLALIANKGDMEHQRTVPYEKQVRFANDNGISSHSISARTGENVSLCFQRICAEFLGLRLTKAEQEEQLNIVKAEIVTQNGPQVASVQAAPSAICSLQ